MTSLLNAAGIMPPEGLCPACLREDRWLVLDRDGCRLIALHCPHTGYGASRKLYAAGVTGPWLIAGPVSTAEFMKFARMWSGLTIAGSFKGKSAENLVSPGLPLGQPFPV